MRSRFIGNAKKMSNEVLYTAKINQSEDLLAKAAERRRKVLEERGRRPQRERNKAAENARKRSAIARDRLLAGRRADPKRNKAVEYAQYAEIKNQYLRGKWLP